jgi:hypothetical protein
VAVSASIVRDDHSQALFGIRVVQDITELKRARLARNCCSTN